MLPSTNTEQSSTPEGWKKVTVERKGGATAGRSDTYFYSPSGQKFRSKVEIANYLRKENIDLSIDNFDFSSSSTTKTKNVSHSSSFQRKPGRPRKNSLTSEGTPSSRKPGRPKKFHLDNDAPDESAKKGSSTARSDTPLRLTKKAASAIMRDDLKDSGRLRKRKETPEEREKRLGSMQSTKIEGMTIEDEIEKIISTENKINDEIKLGMQEITSQQSSAVADLAESSSNSLKERRNYVRHHANNHDDVQLDEMNELARAVSLGLRGKSWTPRQLADKVTVDTSAKIRKTNDNAEATKPRSSIRKSPLLKRTSFSKTAKITKMRAVLKQKRQQRSSAKSNVLSTAENELHQSDSNLQDRISSALLDDEIDIDDGFIPSIVLKGSTNRKRKRAENADIDVVGFSEKSNKKSVRKSSESSSKSLTMSASSTQKSLLLHRDSDSSRSFRRRKHSSGMFKDFVVDLPSMPGTFGNSSADGVMFVTMPPYPDHAYCCLSLPDTGAEDQGQGAWRSLSDDDDTMPAIPDGTVGSVSPGKSAFSWSPPSHHSLRFSPRAAVNFEPSPLNHISMWTGSSLGIMHSDRPPSVLLEDDMPADGGTEFVAAAHSHKRRFLSGPIGVASFS